MFSSYVLMNGLVTVFVHGSSVSTHSSSSNSGVSRDGDVDEYGVDDTEKDGCRGEEEEGIGRVTVLILGQCEDDEGTDDDDEGTDDDDEGTDDDDEGDDDDDDDDDDSMCLSGSSSSSSNVPPLAEQTHFLTLTNPPRIFSVVPSVV